MRELYTILGIAGWVWLVIFGLILGAMLLSRLRRTPRVEARGFEVIKNEDHEKQS